MKKTIIRTITKIAAASVSLVTLVSCMDTPSSLGNGGFTLPADITQATPNTSTPSGGTQTTPSAANTTLPSYDYAAMDLSLFLTLPEDYRTHDYSEGLTLLGAPTDADIDAEIRSSCLIQFAKYSDKSAGADAVLEDLDRVIMDYTGKLDGVAFQGGSATNAQHDVSVLYSQFIDGFDRGMLGMKEGETRDLNLKFPDNYGSTDLAGKEVVFTVTVHKIIRPEIPALTDDLVATHSDVFGKEYTTAADFRKAVADAMTAQNKSSDEKQLKNAAWAYLAKSTEFHTPPEDILKSYEDFYYSYYVAKAKQYGISIEEFATEAGYLSLDAFKQEVITTTATNMLKEKLVIYSVAKDMDISFTDEEAKEKANEEFKTYIEPNIAYYTYYYGVTDFDSFLTNLWSGLGEYKDNLMYSEILNRICIITE